MSVRRGGKARERGGGYVWALARINRRTGGGGVGGGGGGGGGGDTR